MELDEMEFFYIQYYNSIFPNGYNLQSGGKVGPSHELIKKKISELAKGLNPTELQLKSLSIGRKLKPVFRQNLLTGEIKKYDSLSSVSVDGFSSKGVSRAIHSRTGMHKSYFWYFQDKTPRGKMKNPQIKPVLCFDMDDNLIKKYETMSQVSRDNFSVSCVSQCCNGILKSHKKRKFRFDTSPPPPFENEQVLVQDMLPQG